jgi:predicted nucleic acid-binding protein
MRRVLIDTGAIYAFVTRNDKHHSEAVAFVKKWLAQQGVLFFTAGGNAARQ